MKFAGLKIVVIIALTSILALTTWSILKKEPPQKKRVETNTMFSPLKIKKKKNINSKPNILNQIWSEYGNPQTKTDLTKEYKQKSDRIEDVQKWVFVLPFKKLEKNMNHEEYTEFRTIRRDIIQKASRELTENGYLPKFTYIELNELYNFTEYENGITKGYIKIEQLDILKTTLRIELVVTKYNMPEIKTIKPIVDKTVEKNITTVLPKYPENFYELKEFDPLFVKDYTKRVQNLYPNKNILSAVQWSKEITYDNKWNLLTPEEQDEFFKVTKKLTSLFDKKANEKDVVFDFAEYEEGLSAGVWSIYKDDVEIEKVFLYIAQDSPRKNPTIRFRILQVILK